MKTLTIATRGSRLALWQAGHIRELLQKEHGYAVELLVLKTRGDVILDVPLSKVGGKGLFVKEIEEALLDGRADLAVHSMKDVPMELPEGLILSAVPEREDRADMLLSWRFPDLDSLPQGARVGTSSLRRQAQLLKLRPDLEVLSLRGNVDTRMRKLEEGQFEAIVMAAAGIRRLGLSAPFMQPLEAPAFLPAAGQGALGIEIKADRQDLADMLAFLNHEPSRICVEAERGFLAGLEGGCQVPIAAMARLADEPVGDPADSQSGLLTIEGLVADVRGRHVIRKSLSGRAGQSGWARDLGLALADRIKAMGGAEILRELYQEAGHAQT
ncbi:hydroxymethylbilane synthase [Desulfovibrio sp. OttesenSCG-928-G11]|nr:hydroxymethylbilane synthase [Desulfovibrio sp. OttesenSCG-928-G11]